MVPPTHRDGKPVRSSFAMNARTIQVSTRPAPGLNTVSSPPLFESTFDMEPQLSPFRNRPLPMNSRCFLLTMSLPHKDHGVFFTFTSSS